MNVNENKERLTSSPHANGCSTYGKWVICDFIFSFKILSPVLKVY